MAGDAELATRLIAASAELEARTQTWKSTPLHTAAKFGHVAAVQALLAAGAQIDAPAKVRSAACSCRLEVASVHAVPCHISLIL